MNKKKSVKCLNDGELFAALRIRFLRLGCNDVTAAHCKPYFITVFSLIFMLKEALNPKYPDRVHT